MNYFREARQFYQRKYGLYCLKQRKEHKEEMSYSEFVSDYQKDLNGKKGVGKNERS